MEKTKFFLRGFFATIVACLIALMGACTTEEFGEGTTPTPNPDPDPTPTGTTVEVISTNLKHGEWIVTSTLVSDDAVSQNNLKITKDGKAETVTLNEGVPYTIKHKEHPEMRRSKAEFTLLDIDRSAEQVVEETKNGNVKIEKVQKTTTFNYEGLARTYTSVSTRVSHLLDGKATLANYVEDSITPGKQESKILEHIELNKEAYVRKLVTFTDYVYTTDYSTYYPEGHQIKREITEQVIVTAPENPVPGKDYFEGFIEGEERLYWTSQFTYVAEKDVTEFWSVSGKKNKTYKTVYDVRQSIQDQQLFKIVGSWMIGNPKVTDSSTTSQPYTKPNQPGFEFEKTTTIWTALWLNGFSLQITASSERAWVIQDGERIMAMPFSQHKYYFNKYTPGNAVEKEHNNLLYLAYLHTLFFDGNYNNDPYNLSQVQEFYVEKGSDKPDDTDKLIKENIIKKFELINGKHISSINFQKVFQQTGVKDSIVTQEFKHSVRIEDKKNFVRENNNLNLKDVIAPEMVSKKTDTDKETGHVITSWSYQYGFDFDFFKSYVSVDYQTGYTMYKGNKEEFLSDTPKVNMTGSTPTEIGLIPGKDGKKYNRTNYKIKYSESYNNSTENVFPEVDIDVEDKTVPKTDYVEDFKFTSKYDAKTMTSIGTWWIKRHLSGEKDSTSVINVVKKVTVHPYQHFYGQNLTYRDVQDPDITTETAPINGNQVTTTTMVNKFLYNLFLGKVEVEYTSAAKTEFAGKECVYDIPAMPIINYAGMDDKDMGVIIGDDKVEYNRTNYTLKYKETWNGTTMTHTAEVDVDRKKDIVTRTSWQALNKKLEKYDDKRQKSSFTFHEEFSDGSKKDTYVEILLYVYGKSPAKQTVKRDHANLANGKVTEGQTTTSTRTEGEFITVTTNEVNYTQTYDPELTAVYPFVHETAVYVNGDATVNFLVSKFNVVNGGFENPYEGEVPEGSVKYDRYNCVLKLNATYNNDSYNQSAEIDVDVKKKDATRTYWEAKDKGLEYISQRQHRSYFTLYEEYSDGTKKNTLIETYLNIYGENPAYRIIDRDGAEFSFVSITPGAPQNGSRKDGDYIFINSIVTPYNALYRNAKGQELTNAHPYGSETATYRNGEIVVDFLTDSWNISANGNSAPLQGIVTKGYDEYNRYNGVFNIQGTYNGHDYPTTAKVDIDVIIVHESNIDWEKTKLYGGASYTWDVVNGKLVPKETVSFIVKDGVFNITEGLVEFTPMDISRINSRVSAVLNNNNGNRTKYTASTLEVMKGDTNPFWRYVGFDGVSIANVNGVDILKIDGVSIDKPFINTPQEGDMYKFSNGRLTITLNGQVVYNGYGTH